MAKTGKCLCGAVRYTLKEAVQEYGACHCNTCRRWTGGIELGFQVMPGGLMFEGEDNIATYQSSDWAERGWCKTCGSNLFWRMTADGPMTGMMAVTAGTLDSLEGLEMTTELYIEAKPAGHAFAGEHTRMTEAELLASMGITPPDGAGQG